MSMYTETNSGAISAVEMHQTASNVIEAESF